MAFYLEGACAVETRMMMTDYWDSWASFHHVHDLSPWLFHDSSPWLFHVLYPGGLHYLLDPGLHCLLDPGLHLLPLLPLLLLPLLPLRLLPLLPLLFLFHRGPLCSQCNLDVFGVSGHHLYVLALILSRPELLVFRLLVLVLFPVLVHGYPPLFFEVHCRRSLLVQMSLPSVLGHFQVLYLAPRQT